MNHTTDVSGDSMYVAVCAVGGLGLVCCQTKTILNQKLAIFGLWMKGGGLGGL